MPPGDSRETASGSASALRGIAAVVAGLSFITVSDAILKDLSSHLPVGELLCLRSVFILLWIGVYVSLRGNWALLHVNNRRGHLVRAVFASGANFTFIYGISLLPLADAVAITFSGPLITTALAALVLREDVGPRRWMAVVVGFAGVLIMLRPSGDSFIWAMLLPLGTAMSGAFRDIVTRRISRTESSLSVLATSTAFVLIISPLITAPWGMVSEPMLWKPPTLAQLGWIMVAGFVLAVSQFLLVEAYRLAEASLVSPFKYFGLISAALAGYLIWGDIPDWWLVIGALIVAGTGLYILKAEPKSSR